MQEITSDDSTSSFSDNSRSDASIGDSPVDTLNGLDVHNGGTSIANILADEDSEEQYTSMLPQNSAVRMTGPVVLGNKDSERRYELWTVNELRAECKLRGVSVPHAANKAGRIERLRAHDAVAPALLQALGRPVPPATNIPQVQRGSNCVFRLLNVLFSDEFSTRFSETGDIPTREQLDRGTPLRVAFWRDVAVAFAQEKEEYGLVAATDEIFVTMNVMPSIIKPHSAENLKAMWRTVNGYFKVAMGNCTLSGEHDHFPRYCVGQADVLYLWRLLQDKKDLISFVNGGLLEEDQLDSLDEQLHPGRSTPTKSRPNGQSPGKRKRTPTKSPSPSVPTKKAKRGTKSDEAIDALAQSVQRYMASRDTAASSTKSTGISARVASLKALDELRVCIATMQRDLATATGPVKEMLEEDLRLYVEERKYLVEELGRR